MNHCKIMLGISGAGKSTLANRLLRATPMPPGSSGVIVSADHYFERNGAYHFDPQKLGAAHGTCWDKFSDAINKNYFLVIVDNTNVTFKDLKKYYEHASSAGYSVEIIAVTCPVEIAVARNTHGVPTETIQKMAARFDSCVKNIQSHHWNLKTIQTYNASPTSVENPSVYESQGI